MKFERGGEPSRPGSVRFWFEVIVWASLVSTGWLLLSYALGLSEYAPLWLYRLISTALTLGTVLVVGARRTRRSGGRI